MIQQIHIDNFRILKNFSLERIGQINLITGLNGGGKSSLLDYINSDATCQVSRLSKIQMMAMADGNYSPNLSNTIILLDDIETGLHFTKYKPLLMCLFKDAKENNNQLFITTHSKELSEAYYKTAYELFTLPRVENPETGEWSELVWTFDVRWIELMIHYKTRQTTYVNMEVNMLRHKIVQGGAFRGE